MKGKMNAIGLALLMIVSALAGCTVGEEKMTKEELVEKIRNGEGFINGEHLTKGADLSGADLSGLQNSELYALDFTGANLEGTDFTDSDLTAATFSDSSFLYTTFQNTNLENAFFSGDYQNIDFHDSNLQGATFTGFLDSVRFYNVDLSFASFSGVTLNGIVVADSTLYDTNFGCFEMEGGARFTGNNFEHVRLNNYLLGCPGPQWGNTLFEDNTFDHVSFEGWNGDEYYGTRFECNTFSNSEFVDADFYNASFRTVFKVGADGNVEEFCEQTFTDSLMRHSTFGMFRIGTSFIRSDFSWSSIHSVDEEVTWYDTICPDQTNSDENGNTCENNL